MTPIDRGGAHHQLLEVYARAPAGLTAWEAAEPLIRHMTAFNITKVRSLTRRVGDLLAWDYVTDTGRRRLGLLSGTPEYVLALTFQGRHVLDWLVTHPDAKEFPG